jgi:hypothetical protein
MEWKRRRRRSQFSMKSEIPGEECVSLLYSAAWKGMNGRRLIIQSINRWPIIIVKQTNRWYPPPPPLYHYHITPIDGWRAVHQPPEYLWIRIFILASCDRLIVYSPKMFQRPFFTKIYFSRGEIHFRLIHHSTKRKYHTADERFCIYWFIYFQKPILVWWFASGSGL